MIAVPSIRGSSLEQVGHSSPRASRLLKHATSFISGRKRAKMNEKVSRYKYKYVEKFNLYRQNFMLHRKLFFNNECFEGKKIGLRIEGRELDSMKVHFVRFR